MGTTKQPGTEGGSNKKKPAVKPDGHFCYHKEPPGGGKTISPPAPSPLQLLAKTFLTTSRVPGTCHRKDHQPTALEPRVAQ